MTKGTQARERVQRYIVVHEQSNRIVATTGGTHAMMERVCDNLGRRRAGTYFYDDASSARLYLPQVGPNVALNPRVQP